jgi:threonine aldolase
MFFASDNAGPVAPQIMDAIVAANQGYAMAYGNDPLTDHVRDMIRDLFEAPDAVVHLVTTGTAANSLALASMTRPWDAIFCHHEAHIQASECGAPEFYTGGARIVALDGVSGKIDPAALKLAMTTRIYEGSPATTLGPVNLTQVTDRGAIYTLDEIRTITAIARSFGSTCHMDGARFANALVALGCTPAEMTWKAGIDVLSFGGTKNGMMGAEAVVFFKPELALDFEQRRLRGAHMISKQRFMAAQYQAYLTDGLWLELAQKANTAAQKLEQALGDLKFVSFEHQRQANMLFANWPRANHRRALAAGARYAIYSHATVDTGPDTQDLTARLVCNWATTDEDIADLIALVKG